MSVAATNRADGCVPRCTPTLLQWLKDVAVHQQCHSHLPGGMSDSAAKTEAQVSCKGLCHICKSCLVFSCANGIQNRTLHLCVHAQSAPILANQQEPRNIRSEAIQSSDCSSSISINLGNCCLWVLLQALHWLLSNDETEKPPATSLQDSSDYVHFIMTNIPWTCSYWWPITEISQLHQGIYSSSLLPGHPETFSKHLTCKFPAVIVASDANL